MDAKFYDLNVPLRTLTPALLARLLDSNFHYIGVSQSVNIDEFNFHSESASNAGKKKNKEERHHMRENLLVQLKPPSSDYLETILQNSFELRASVSTPNSFSRPRMLKRLNLECQNPSLAGLFFREFGDFLNDFDVVAFCPSSVEALSFACEQVPSVDLITVDFSNNGDFRLSSKQCSALVNRGLHLEFYFAPLVRSNASGFNARTNLANYFASLFSCSRLSFNKSIVVSSNATSPWEVRRPIAIISVLRCLGVKSNEIAQQYFTCNAHAAVTHGLIRSKTAHGAAVLLRLLPMPNVISISDVSDRGQSNIKFIGEETVPKEISTIKSDA